MRKRPSAIMLNGPVQSPVNPGSEQVARICSGVGLRIIMPASPKWSEPQEVGSKPGWLNFVAVGDIKECEGQFQILDWKHIQARCPNVGRLFLQVRPAP